MGNTSSSAPLDASITSSLQSSWAVDPASGGMSKEMDMMGLSSQDIHSSTRRTSLSSSRRRTSLTAVAEIPPSLEADRTSSTAKTNTRIKRSERKGAKGRNSKTGDSMNSHLEEIEAFVTMIKQDKQAKKTFRRSMTEPVAVR